jgi:hypothetical protein
MIDSADRDENVYQSPWNFQITKRQSVQNGFMTRCATTEVVLEWYIPNISEAFGNNTLIVDISGSGLVTNRLITIDEGFYTVEQLFDEIVVQLDAVAGTGVTFSVDPVVSPFSRFDLVATGGEFRIRTATALSEQLLLEPQTTVVPSYPLFQGIDIRLYRYLDFVSPQLTYNQDLKDNSTADIERDVLCRWYMAYDATTPGTTTVDAYGFPILMGYEPFVLRRLFNPPKQIKWDPLQPMGNLTFQVFGNDGDEVVDDDGDRITNWLMTLQLSEN